MARAKSKEEGVEAGGALKGGWWHVPLGAHLYVRVADGLTLGMFQRWAELDTEVDRIGEALAQVPDGDLLERNILLVELLEARQAQVAAAVHPADAGKVKDLTLGQVAYLETFMRLEDAVSPRPVTRFLFPAGLLPDEVKLHRPKGWRRFVPHKPRQAGWFMALPAAQAPLRSRQHTDALDAKAAEGLPLDLLKETTQADKNVELLRKRLRAGQFGVLHELLAHVCVPEGTRYDEAKAKERAELFKGLPLSVAAGVADFFGQAAGIWKLSSRMSSEGRTKGAGKRP